MIILVVPFVLGILLVVIATAANSSLDMAIWAFQLLVLLQWLALAVADHATLVNVIGVWLASSFGAASAIVACSFLQNTKH